ncbi:MAG: ATPase, T2SS/T4P/T4SS family [Planctomycetaceae bacterium]
MFGGRKDEDEDEDEEEEIELVLFQGALNGKEPNMKENQRLVQAGLNPAKELVTDGLSRRAETIRVEPKGERSQVAFVVDGMPYAGGKLTKPQGLAITQMLKLLAGLDIKVRDQPQSGGLKAQFNELPYELVVQTKPQPDGSEVLSIKVRNLKDKLLSPDELGMSELLKKKIREWTSLHKGLSLAVGAPNSGVTTTAFGMLKGVDCYMFQIHTLRDFGTREVNNVSVFEVNKDDTLEHSLTRVIRIESDVVFMEPLLTAEEAKIAFQMQAQISLLSEMPAKDCASAIVQLVQWIGDASVVANGLMGVINAKLIRKICPDCRQAYRPNPKLIAKVGLPTDTKTLYRKPVATENEEGEVEEPPPCEKCGDTGYFGRTGIFECIEMTDPIKECVIQGGDANAIRTLARQQGMMTFSKDALRHVAKGVTSLEELQRVFKPAS